MDAIDYKHNMPVKIKAGLMQHEQGAYVNRNHTDYSRSGLVPVHIPKFLKTECWWISPIQIELDTERNKV